MSETEIGSFDSTAYRQRVLARLRGASLDLSDPFFIVDLPVDVDDEALIRARIVALVGFWNKERSPNYKALTAELAGHRAELEAVLLDPAARAACATRVRQARTAADADRYESLDSLAGRLTARYQGLPRSRIPGLAGLARSKGIDDAAFAAWIARHQIIEDGADADPLPAGLRAQIRSDLDELGRLTGDPARSATLWTFLDLPATSPDADVQARHAELASQNDLRQHDRQMTVAANLLTYARQHLMTGDRARYTASLVEDAKDRVREAVAEKVIVDGELTAADYEACVLRVLGFGFGLSGEQARTAVRQVAAGLGATLAVAPATDYLICPNCREPQAAGEHDTCRYCGADLFISCPSCAQRVEAAAIACPRCGASFRLLRGAQDQLAKARDELAQGRPAAARQQLAGAQRAAQDAPALARDVESAARDIERVMAAAESDWRAADQDVAAHRLYSAIDRLSRIARVASDVPGPAGVLAGDRLEELASAKAQVQADITRARALSGEQREAALGRILAVAADCAEAIDLLAAVPLATPGGLRAEVTADAVILTWSASPAQGPVSYKITRIITGPGGAQPEARVLGTTSSTDFEDAGVPGGAIVGHEVAASSGRRTSAPARTSPVLLAREVASVAARAGPAGITISWQLPIRSGSVIVERETTEQAGLKFPQRRARAEGQSWLDARPTPGVEFTYHVYAEYRDAAGQLVRTTGTRVRASAVTRPGAAG